MFENSEDILKCLDYIRNREDVIAFEDRWNVPLESGYMDVISYLRMSNGVIGELQFSLKAILDLNDIDHKLYEYIRTHIDNKAYRKVDRRIINVKKKLIKLAVDGKGDTINDTKPQLAEIAEELLKTRTPEEAEKYISLLEDLVNKI